MSVQSPNGGAQGERESGSSPLVSSLVSTICRIIVKRVNPQQERLGPCTPPRTPIGVCRHASPETSRRICAARQQHVRVGFHALRRPSVQRGSSGLLYSGFRGSNLRRSSWHV